MTTVEERELMHFANRLRHAADGIAGICIGLPDAAPLEAARRFAETIEPQLAEFERACDEPIRRGSEQGEKKGGGE